MSVWYCIPSKRPDGGTAPLWRAKGYKVALFRDAGDPPVEADLILTGKYPGYGAAVNALCAEVIARDKDADWLVTGGDDVEPDHKHAPEDIGTECSAYFARNWASRYAGGFDVCNPENGDPIAMQLFGGIIRGRSRSGAIIGSSEFIKRTRTFGVMQPTGDRWGDDPLQQNFCGSAYADRVCCSPWMGREFCRRMYGGDGPFWSGWHHMRVDEELQEVAIKLGVLWQRQDIIHLHRHWARADAPVMPGFLAEVNGAQHWVETTQLFKARRDAGFPGHEPIEMEVTA